MSGDHNMNQTDSGWRKRQIALDAKAENARELGLDYEPSKTVIEMAREAVLHLYVNDLTEKPYAEVIERFAAIVRADERNAWPLEMEAMERQVNILTDALAQEREACAEVCKKHADVYAMLERNPIANAAWAACIDNRDAIRARSNT